MIDTKFRGMGVALITPIKEDDSVDYEALSRLLDYQLQNDIDFIVALGTSAETPTLTEEEKEEVLNFIISKVHGRVPIVLGLGGNNTKALVDQLKTRRFDGVDAILSVVPFYNKPSQEGMIQHYSALAEASPVPIIMYNVPGRTGVNMKAETESPPPITETAPFLVASTIASKTAFVPSANFGFSKAPTGPFIKIVFDDFKTSAKAFLESIPASTPSNPSGISLILTNLFVPLPEKSSATKTSVAITSFTPFSEAFFSIAFATSS